MQLMERDPIVRSVINQPSLLPIAPDTAKPAQNAFSTTPLVWLGTHEQDAP